MDKSPVMFFDIFYDIENMAYIKILPASYLVMYFVVGI